MRILLVEDEEKVSRFIVRGLETERFAFDAAHDGTGGLVESLWELSKAVWRQSNLLPFAKVEFQSRRRKLL
jgi:hypothetical protein